MSAEGKPMRRLRLLRGGHAPGVSELDALLREVDDLRLTLETDLSLVASAVESGATELAVEILDADQLALHRFEDRALDQLATLADTPRRRSWVPAHAGPAVAAAALVAVLAGLMPQAITDRPSEISSSTAAATDSLARLQDFAARGDTQQMRLASATLHQQLASVVSHAKSDPMAAQQALLILSYEQSAIVANGNSDVLADVLVRSRQLSQAIRAALPKGTRSGVPVTAVHEPTPSPSPKASASPKPSPTASPKDSPKATSSSPTPSASPTKDDGLVPPAPAPSIEP